MGNACLLSWSGGKDSALALGALRATGTPEVRALHTVLTEGFERVSMHGVRRELIERQAAATGLELEIVWLPVKAPNEAYEARLREYLSRKKAEGIDTVAFGDLFLEDVRRYRQTRLAEAGLGAHFPLWGRNPADLARQFVRESYRAIVTCVDTEKIPASFAGRYYDESFLADLPKEADPCGENGEFHTFVFEGPIFRESIPVRRGEIVLRENGRFVYADVLSTD